MSMQDPIADMFIRIKNASAVNKKDVRMSASTVKSAIAKVLEDEGFILGFRVEGEGSKKTLIIDLKYHNEKPVIRQLDRVSKSSLRVYKPANDLPEVKEGLGIAIVSTSKGLMTDRQARKLGLGGEIMCYVS